MAGRQLHRLSALRVAKEVAPSQYAEGGGLYMQIADSGARSWVFRFKLGGSSSVDSCSISRRMPT